MQYDFNPRSREGSDIFPFLMFKVSVYFNPRSREGSDKHNMTRYELAKNFNPRSREGSDHIRLAHLTND